MSTKNPEESIVKIEEDGEVKELYLAANPFGNFVVEFEKDECSNLKAKKALSYRILSEIETPKPKTFEFTQMQSDLITSKNKLSWSVAVSDKLYKHESRQSTARLLAISCISKDDMTYMTYGKPQN
ncbi:22251_t:CDS:2, partial [Gigaspora rosea]